MWLFLFGRIGFPSICIKSAERKSRGTELNCANGFDEEFGGPVLFQHHVNGAWRSSEISIMCTLLASSRQLFVAFVLIGCPVFLNAQEVGLIRDVQLSNSGTLQGAILSHSANAAAADSVVQIRYQGKTVAVAKAGIDGRFAIGQMRPGVHEVVTAGCQTPVRIWANGTAPAGCQSQLMLQPQEYATQFPSQSSAACGEVVGQRTGGVPCRACDQSAAFGMVDAISLVTVGSSIAALVIAIDANRTADSASRSAATAVLGANTTNNNTNDPASP